jgi:two-component system, NtrC family, nitrogen regulation response regulator NtrX
MALTRYRWPGNVRELANIVERLSILFAGQPIGAAEVASVLPAASPRAAPTALPEGEQLAMPLSDDGGRIRATADHPRALRGDGVVSDAARRLNTDRPNLYRRMKRLGISGAQD